MNFAYHDPTDHVERQRLLDLIAEQKKRIEQLEQELEAERGRSTRDN
jgi:hypothetical protein